MKIIILAFVLVSGSALASEKEGVDTCTSLRHQKDNIMREQARLSAEFFTKEDEGSWSVPTDGPFNCEEVPDSRAAALKRYDALSREIVKINGEIERYCPRSYPE